MRTRLDRELRYVLLLAAAGLLSAVLVAFVPWYDAGGAAAAVVGTFTPLTELPSRY